MSEYIFTESEVNELSLIVDTEGVREAFVYYSEINGMYVDRIITISELDQFERDLNSQLFEMTN